MIRLSDADIAAAMRRDALADAIIAAVAERDRQWRAWFSDLMRLGLPGAKVPIAPDCQPEDAAHGQ